MSQNFIEFTCPSCQTALRVPAEMAGVQGPCPTCSNTISAPPQAHQAKSGDSEVRAAAPKAIKRRIWPAIVFPVLFLALLGMAIYLTLDLMGIIKTPVVAPKEEPKMTPNATLSTPRPEKPPGISEQATAEPASGDNFPSFVEEAPTEDTEEPALPDPPASLPDESSPPLNHDPRDIQKNGEVPAEIPELVKKNSRTKSSLTRT